MFWEFSPYLPHKLRICINCISRHCIARAEVRGRPPRLQWPRRCAAIAIPLESRNDNRIKASELLPASIGGNHPKDRRGLLCVLRIAICESRAARAPACARTVSMSKTSKPRFTRHHKSCGVSAVIVKLEPAASRYLSFSGFASQMSKYDYPAIEKRIEACTYQAPDLPHCRNTTGRLQKAPYRGRVEHSSSCRGAIVRLEDSVGLAVRNYCRQLSTLSRPEVYTAWCGPCLSIAAATDSRVAC